MTVEPSCRVPLLRGTRQCHRLLTSFGHAYSGSLVLVLLGVVLLVASLFQGDGNAAYAFGLLIFGSGLVTLGVVLPRARNAEEGPLAEAWFDLYLFDGPAAAAAARVRGPA